MTRISAALTILSFFSFAGCSDDPVPQKPWPDGLGTGDGRIFYDFAVADLGAPPDLGGDKNGPAIDVLGPKPNEVVLTDILKVQAKITDPDVVDDQTVQVTLKGGKPTKMSLTTTPYVYEALLDVATVAGATMLWVEAWDLKGQKGSRIVTFVHDPGPKIIFSSPAEGSRHRASVSLQVVVFDVKNIASFEARIGSVKLNLQKTVDEGKKQVWSGTIQFDDKIFSPPLTGQQVIVATAANAAGAKSTAQRSFVVDDQGPAITVLSHKPGDLIGGIITVRATVTDGAGVLPTSVICVIGNKLDTRSVAMKPVTGDTYEGAFDTRTLSQYDLWPVMSFRAADKLGNESHQEIQVGLDNGQPIVELDPSATYHAVEKKEGKQLCSVPFDPVGCDAADDKMMVPQIAKLRARIEDQGNWVPSAQWLPVSEVSPSSVKLFILDDTTKPLIVDIDEDGYCDDINPEVLPSSLPSSQAVAVNLAAIPGTGKAYFPASAVKPPPTCHSWADQCVPGADEKRPDPLCQAVGQVDCVDKLTTAIKGDTGKPAIWTIPPIASDTWHCAGLPFDFKANAFQPGWVCAAATATDNLGNRGVSPPLRLWVDLTLASSEQKPLPTPAPPPAPDCTGTLVKATGKVDASKPCKLRDAQQFPQRFCVNDIQIP